MYVKELLLRLDFNKVWEEIKSYYYNDLSTDISYLEFKKAYPDKTEEDFLDKVKDNIAITFDEIKEVEVVNTNEAVLAVHKYFEYDEDTDLIDPVWDTCYYIKGEDEAYSLMGLEWEKFLGLPVLDKSIGEYGEDIVAAHIVWELTFMGYTRETASEESKKLFERLDESLKDIENSNFYTMAEVEEHLADHCTETEEERAEFLKQLRTEPENTEYIEKMNQKALEMTKKITSEYSKSAREYLDSLS
jgi:hypothetical protein